MRLKQRQGKAQANARGRSHLGLLSSKQAATAHPPRFPRVESRKKQISVVITSGRYQLSTRMRYKDFTNVHHEIRGPAREFGPPSRRKRQRRPVVVEGSTPSRLQVPRGVDVDQFSRRGPDMANCEIISMQACRMGHAMRGAGQRGAQNRAQLHQMSIMSFEEMDAAMQCTMRNAPRNPYHHMT